MALWRLASGNAYRTVASTFGIGKSAAVEITNSFIHALNELYENWITFPASVQETSEAIQRFSDNNLFNIAQIVGAIDGSHIPIKAPKHNKESYFNRKHFYFMNLQAVVGFDGRFLDISAGFPGSIHDTRVLRMSELYGRLLGNDILRGPYINLIGVSVGPLIVGDSAYPIFPWLLKPYHNVRNLDPTKVQFKTVLSKIRVIVEHTLGVLKGRWKCLRKELEILAENVPGTIAACCILHNICIENGEPDPDIDDSDDDDDSEDDFVDGGTSANADAVRCVLRRNLLHL